MGGMRGAASLGLVVWLAATARAAEPDLRLPLVVHVLHKGGAPVAEAGAVARMVAGVNALYADAGICFAVREVRDLDRDADLRSYRDRRTLRAFTVARAVNIFLVASIFDPEASESTRRALARVGRLPGHWLAGAEIPAPRRQPSIYLIVQLEAGWKTMAHELGHFLGEGHAREPDNLMSYAAERRHFDADQLGRLRRRALGQLRARALDRAAVCAPAAARD